jgi:type VI secretion system protein ImpM
MAFWRRRQPQPPVVSCYGKLPATGDFIRLNAHGAENHAFDTWLGTSIAHAKQALGNQFSTAFGPTLGLFIYRGDDGDGSDEPERGMIGAWAASGDSAGRNYPMLVSTSYDYEEMLAVGPALPIAVWPFLTTAYDLVANGRSLQPNDFTQRVAMIQPMAIEHAQSVSMAYHDWLKNQRMRALWETAFGSIDARFHVVQSVQATIEIFRGQERPQTSLAIRFPIGAGDAYAAAVWMDMTLRLANWERTVLNAFWTPQHDLVIHIGPPQTGTFRELIANSDAEYMTDLMLPPTTDPAAARQQLGPLADLVDNVDQTIHAFLYGLKPSA